MENNELPEKRNFIKSTLKELSQPFIDLTKTSRALLGVNISYVLEGITYFGVVGLLAIFFNDYIALDDQKAGYMVGSDWRHYTCHVVAWGYC